MTLIIVKHHRHNPLTCEGQRGKEESGSITRPKKSSGLPISLSQTSTCKYPNNNIQILSELLSERERESGSDLSYSSTHYNRIG